MGVFLAFFGQYYLLAAIIGGLVWLFSPRAGKVIAKRVGISAVLFTAGCMLWPDSQGSVVIRAIRLVLCVLIFLASLLYPIWPSMVLALLKSVAALVGVALILRAGFVLLGGGGAFWVLLATIAASGFGYNRLVRRE